MLQIQKLAPRITSQQRHTETTIAGIASTARRLFALALACLFSITLVGGCQRVSRNRLEPPEAEAQRQRALIQQLEKRVEIQASKTPLSGEITIPRAELDAYLAQRSGQRLRLTRIAGNADTISLYFLFWPTPKRGHECITTLGLSRGPKDPRIELRAIAIDGYSYPKLISGTLERALNAYLADAVPKHRIERLHSTGDNLQIAWSLSDH